MSVRHPAVAGSFYPGSEAAIRRAFEELQPGERPVLRGDLRALIAPHAGWRYSGALLARALSLLQAYKQECGARLRIVHIGPSHYEHFAGAALSPDDQWVTPLGSVAVARWQQGRSHGVLRELPRPHLLEHSLEVQLAMLQLFLDDFDYLPLLTGQVEPAELAAVLETLFAELDADASGDAARTVFLASTDLSHFYTDAQARKLDRVCNEAIPAVDIERMESAGDLCGKAGVLAVMHLARRHGWRGELLGYMTSVDAGGPRSEVVGYGAYAFWA